MTIIINHCIYLFTKKKTNVFYMLLGHTPNNLALVLKASEAFLSIPYYVHDPRIAFLEASS